MVWACAAKRRWWFGEEMHGVWSRGSKTKRTWSEVVEKDCQACKQNKEDAMDRSKWRKLIKDVRWSGWMWVGECFFLYRPTWVVPDQGPLNGCVCVLLQIVDVQASVEGGREFVAAGCSVESHQVCGSLQCRLVDKLPHDGWCPRDTRHSCQFCQQFRCGAGRGCTGQWFGDVSDDRLIDSAVTTLLRLSTWFLISSVHIHICRVAQKEPDYSTFQPRYENLHKIALLTLVVHR